jgi:hypothetical protein
MAAPIWAASFLVMMVTVTRGTGRILQALGSGLWALGVVG